MFSGFLAIFLSGAISGAINAVAVKQGIREIPPITFTTIRFLLSTVCFLPFFFITLRGKLYRKDIITLCVMSLFFAANLALFSIGIQYTSAMMSQILYILSPIIVVIVAHFLIGEKYTKEKGIGLIISLCGIIFFIYQSASHQSLLTFGTPFGNMLILIGVICYSLYTVASKKLTHAYSSTTIIFFNFAITTIVLSLLIPFELHFRPFIFSRVDYIGIISLIALVFSSITGYLLIQIGIKKTSAFLGSLQLYISPFFTALTAIAFIGEKITWEFVFGGFLVAIGVFYATAFDQIKFFVIKKLQ